MEKTSLMDITMSPFERKMPEIWQDFRSHVVGDVIGVLIYGVLTVVLIN